MHADHTNCHINSSIHSMRDDLVNELEVTEKIIEVFLQHILE
jgi:hypothetical protein